MPPPRPLPLLLALTLLGLSQCHHRDPSPDPASQLPPATQTGANTFGCLVNGEVMLPKGNISTSNPSLVYDPGYKSGDFTIGIRQYDNQITRSLIIEAAPFTKAGTYSFLRPNGICTARYLDQSGSANSCGAITSDQDIAYRNGTLEVTRFDMQTRIASGIFSFKLLPKGCTDTEAV